VSKEFRQTYAQWITLDHGVEKKWEEMGEEREEGEEGGKGGRWEDGKGRREKGEKCGGASGLNAKESPGGDS